MSVTSRSNAIGSPKPGRPSGRGSSRWLALVVLSLAQLMVVLDATIVNIALPSAQSDLGMTNDNRQWVVTGYALAFGSLLLLGGRLSDFFGRKRMFLVGLIGFALASAIGGAADGFTVLLAARVLQGAFAALLAPAALSLLSTTFTDQGERGRAFGIFGAISGAGSAVGLLLGGVLTEYASWRWCLYVNIVIAAIALIGAVVLLRAGERPARQKLDIPGTVTAVIGLVSLVYGLSNAERVGWNDSVTILPIVGGAVFLIAFVIIERFVAHPLLPLRVLTDRNRGAAYVAAAITGAGMFAVFLFLTYYLTDILRFTPLQTGAAFLPMVAGIMVGATVAGSVLLPRLGPRPLIPFGAIVTAVGMWMLTGLSLDSSYAANVLPALIICGVGIGFIFGPLQNAATSGVESRDSGVASAMVNTAQQIGGSIGIAVFSSLFASVVSNYIADHVGPPTQATEAAASISGYQTIFWIAAGVFLVGGVITGLLFRSGPLENEAQREKSTPSSAQ